MVEALLGWLKSNQRCKTFHILSIFLPSLYHSISTLNKQTQQIPDGMGPNFLSALYIISGERSKPDERHHGHPHGRVVERRQQFERALLKLSLPWRILFFQLTTYLISLLLGCKLCLVPNLTLADIKKD